MMQIVESSAMREMCVCLWGRIRPGISVPDRVRGTKADAEGAVSGSFFSEHRADLPNGWGCQNKANIPEAGCIFTPELTDLIKSELGFKNCKLTGRFFYPVNGHLGWHTNSNNPGHRIYISFADEPNRSFFRYKQEESIITSFDSDLDIRMFYAGDGVETPLFWHCVYSETNRFSYGLRLY